MNNSVLKSVNTSMAVPISFVSLLPFNISVKKIKPENPLTNYVPGKNSIVSLWRKQKGKERLS